MYEPGNPASQAHRRGWLIGGGPSGQIAGQAIIQEVNSIVTEAPGAEFAVTQSEFTQSESRMGEVHVLVLLYAPNFWRVEDLN